MRHNKYLENIEFDYCFRKYLISKGMYKGEQKRKLDEEIIKHKREYRKRLKEECALKYLYPGSDGKGYGEIVSGGGSWDSVWQKVFFKGEHWTEDDIEEFRKSNWKQVRYPAYDCTGDWFTWAIDVFNTPKGVVAYIFEAMDV